MAKILPVIILIISIMSDNLALAANANIKADAQLIGAAENGDAQAQVQLAYLYYIGEGVPQSYEQAAKWYRKAAVQGNADAQYNLAVAYAFAEGVPQDYKEAALWYRRAAEQDHAVAQYSLGLSYSYGEGVAQDSVEAAHWFQRAAEQGYVRAQVFLGSKYHTGDGVEQNFTAAVKWYRQAAERGDPVAQYNLGSLYRSGKGLEQDYNQAIRWYRLAADQGYAAAQNQLNSLQRSIAGTAKKTTPIKPATAENTLPEAATATTVATDTDKAEKRGFFSRLFGKKKNSEQSSETVADSPAVAVAATTMLPPPDERQATDSEETNEVSEQSVVAYKPGQSTFAIEANAILALDSIVPTVSIAESVDLLLNSETTPAKTDTPSAAIAETNASGENKKPGFFSRLFGKKQDAEIQAADSTTDSSLENSASKTRIDADTNDAVELELTDDIDALEETTTTESDDSSAGRIPASVDEKTARSGKRRGFFSRLFAKDKGQGAAAVTDNHAENTAPDFSATGLGLTQVAQTASTTAFPVDINQETVENVVVETPAETTHITETSSEEITPPVPIVDADTDLSAIEENNDEQLTDELPLDTATTAEEFSATATETEEINDDGKKPGFFSRLFGHNKKADVETAAAANGAEQLTTDFDSRHYEVIDTVVIDESLLEEDTVVAVAEDKSEEIEISALDELDASKPEPIYIDSIPADTDTMQAALDLLDTGKYQAAFDAFRTMAGAGDAQAMYQIGVLYRQGLGVKQNHEEAARWFTRAAERADADAQYNLGSMFLLGEGMAQNDEQAKFWYGKAAEQGHDAARYNLSKLKKVTASKDKKTSHTEEAETSRGFGGETIINEAAEAETRKASDEVAEGKGFFGRLFGGDDDAETQDSHPDKTQADSEAQTATPQTPVPQPVNPELSAAVAELEEAFEARGGETTESPATDYEKGLAYSLGNGVTKDQAKAFEHFSRAAERGHTAAQYKLGIAYAYGEGTEKNLQEAAQWYAKAAVRGHLTAQRNLGTLYLNGEGVSQNKPLALAWYSILADSGSPMDGQRREQLRQQLSLREIQEAEQLQSQIQSALQN